MKRNIFILLIILCMSYIQEVYGQDSGDSLYYSHYNSGVGTLCLDVNSIRPVYGGTKIIADLPNDWCDEQQAAFRYACELWEEVLPTCFPIRITVLSQTKNQNLSNGDALSRVTTVGEENGYYSPYSYRPQVKATTFMEYIGKYDTDIFHDEFDITYFQEQDFKITYYEYANMKFDDIYSFSIDAGNVGSKYDFITQALRDIAKGLGFRGTWKERNGYLEIDSSKKFPFDAYVTSNLTQHSVNGTKISYNLPTSGQVGIGDGFYLYAPNPWNNNLSLNYFVPDTTRKLTQLLDWDFKRGTVIRSITDNKTNSAFKNFLAWKGDNVTGNSYNPFEEYSTNTSNAVPYGGSIVFPLPDSPDLSSGGMQNNNANKVFQELLDIRERDLDSALIANKKKYHPAYNNDGSTNFNGYLLAVMRKDGTWDVVMSDNEMLRSDLTINTSTLQLNAPDSVYARTYDGKYRMRVSYCRYEWDEVYQVPKRKITTRYYLVGALPQKVKSNMSKCRFKTIYDEYTGVIQVGMQNLEGVTRVIVGQYDDGDTYPYVFEVTDFKKGYFLAEVDREYDTRFVITAYNENGSVSSDMYTFHPMTANYMNLQFVRKGDIIEVRRSGSRRQNKNLIKDATIVNILQNGDNCKSISYDGNYIDISSLRTGTYTLNIVDINGNKHSYKFVK